MTLYLAAALFVGQSPAHPVKFDELRWSGVTYVRTESRINQFLPWSQFDGVLERFGVGYRAAWASRRQNEGRQAIMVRDMDRFGIPIGDERTAATRPSSHEARPAMAQGKVFFDSFGLDGSSYGISENGVRVNRLSKGSQTEVAACALPSGEILTVWTSEISARERRVFAKVGDREFRISNVNQAESAPSVAASETGAVAVWQTKGDGIAAQRISSRGEKVGPPVQLSSSGVEPTISRCGVGWAVGWSALDSKQAYRVTAVVLDGELRPIRNLRTSLTPGWQNGVSISGRADGSCAIAWNSHSDGSTDVYLQTFDSVGKRSSLIRPTLAVKGDQTLAQSSGGTRMLYHASGSIALIWSGNGDLGDGNGVHVTTLTPAGTISRQEIAELSLAAAEFKSQQTAVTVSRKTNEVAIEFVKEIAQSHEPPTFDPAQIADPWESREVLLTGAGFDGVLNTGWTPPDPHMAVGPSHLVVMTNGAIAFFQKNGTKEFQQAIEGGSGFWGSLGATGFVFDPEVLYDPLSGRFFAMAAESISSLNQSKVLVAVSDDSNPNGTWYKYRIDTTGLAGYLFDSPNIGVDADVVYVTGDGFGIGSNYPVYTFDKPSMLAGSPIAISRSTTLPTSTQSAGIAPVAFDSPPRYYMIEHQEGSNRTQVRLIALNDPLGTPNFTTFNLSVPSYSHPEDPPQQGTTSRPETFDARFWSVAYRAGSLWATHHVNGSRVRARWYEIAMNGWPTSGNNPALVQSGEIDPGDPVRTFFGAITVAPNGSAAVVCARSSPGEFISMYRAMRSAGDPLGTMNDTAIVKSSNAGYTAGRWGDYAAVNVDLSDNSFWAIHEYALNNSWRTWIQNFAPIQTAELSINQIVPIIYGGLSGGLAEIAQSDDLYYTVDPGFSPGDLALVSRVDFLATSPSTSPVGLGLRAEIGTTPVSGTAKIWLLNRQTGLYDLILTQPVGPTDTVLTVPPTIPNPSAYVHSGTGEVRLRVDLLRAILSPGRPTAKMDEVKVIVRY